MIEYFRSLTALLVPELLEPANVMMLGLVGVASSHQLRLAVGSALIMGGSLFCALTCLLASLLGMVFPTNMIAAGGSIIIVMIGMALLVSSVRSGSRIEPKLPKAENSFLSNISIWFQSKHLVLQALILGFSLEMAQSSALIVFGMAASSTNPLLTFSGALSAHVLCKTFFLSFAFGFGFLLWKFSRLLIAKINFVRPRLGQKLWIILLRKLIKSRKQSITGTTQQNIAQVAGKIALSLGLVVYGIYIFLNIA